MTRRVGFAVAAMAAGQTAVYVARPVTSYRLLELGHGASAVGLVAAAYALLPLLLAIPLGRGADRRHSGRLLVVGCALETCACGLLALGHSAAALGGASALLGTGHLAVALGSQSVIARESEDSRHDEHFALLTAGVSIGQLVGPLVGGLVLGAHADLPSTTRAMLVAAAIAALATAFAVLGRGPASAPLHVATTPRTQEILRTPGVAAAIFASVAALSATDVFTAYMPVLGQEHGIAPAAIGVLLALRAAASLVSRVGITQVVARIGRTRLIAFTAVTGALAFAAITATQIVAVLVPLVIVLGAALGFAQPLSMTVVVQLVPVHVRASALAVRLSGNRLGQVAAPAAAGLVAGRAGASSVFWMMSGVLVASAVAVQRLERPQPVAEEVERRGDEDGDRLGGTLAETGADQ